MLKRANVLFGIRLYTQKALLVKIVSYWTDRGAKLDIHFHTQWKHKRYQVVKRWTNGQCHVLTKQGHFKRDGLFENGGGWGGTSYLQSGFPAADPESRICVHSVYEGGDNWGSGRSRLGVREEARPGSELRPSPTEGSLAYPTEECSRESPHICPHPRRGKRAFKFSHLSVPGYRLPWGNINPRRFWFEGAWVK